MTSQKIQVIFVTPVAGDVRNGPALYANLLANAFSEDESLDFRMLVPDSARDGVLKAVPALNPSNLSSFTTGSSSRGFYRQMCDAAGRLLESNELKTAIVHCNIAHGVTKLLQQCSRSIVQVNDYNAARIYRDWKSYLQRGDLKRLRSFLWRHHSERRSLQAANHIVANSDFLIQQLKTWYRIPESVSIHRIYKTWNSAVDASTTNQPSNANRSSVKKIGFVGAKWEEKGLDIAIQTLSELVRRGHDMHLHVVGEIRSGLRKLQNLIVRHDVNDRVHFRGALDQRQVSRFLHEMDVFLSTSRSEAFGVAVLEALAAGLPVVAVRCGGIPEILSDMKTSFLTSHNLGEITDAILKAAGIDPGASAQESRDRAAEFSVERMVVSVKSLYQQIA